MLALRNIDSWLSEGTWGRAYSNLSQGLVAWSLGEGPASRPHLTLL